MSDHWDEWPDEPPGAGPEPVEPDPVDPGPGLGGYDDPPHGFDDTPEDAPPPADDGVAPAGPVLASEPPEPTGVDAFVDEPLGDEPLGDEPLGHEPSGGPSDDGPGGGPGFGPADEVDFGAADGPADGGQGAAGFGPADDGAGRAGFGSVDDVPVGADPDALAEPDAVPDAVFPPPLDLPDLPAPVDGYPWTDPAVLGAEPAPDPAVLGAEPGARAPGTPEPAELFAYAGEDPPDDDPADAWAALVASPDPATSALARWWSAGPAG